MSFCKTLTSEARKEIAGEIAEGHDISITRACKLMGIHKSFFYYESTLAKIKDVERKLREMKLNSAADAYAKSVA